MFRRKVLPNPAFDPKAMTYEDQKFLAEIASKDDVLVSDACVAEYRRRDDTLWQRAERDGTGIEARAWFNEWLAQLP